MTPDGSLCGLVLKISLAVCWVVTHTYTHTHTAADWCGPCKLIYPELVKLSAELAPRAVIVKFNCNQANKELAKALGIKVRARQHAATCGSCLPSAHAPAPAPVSWPTLARCCWHAQVAPTFHLYRAGAKVADMTGAKVDKLRQLVADHLAPAGN